MGNALWRVLGTGSAIVAGMVANKAITAVWKKAGRDAEIDPRDPDSPIWEALAYAALAGLAMGVARTFATRQAAQIYQRSTGHLPNELQKGEA